MCRRYQGVTSSNGPAAATDDVIALVDGKEPQTGCVRLAMAPTACLLIDTVWKTRARVQVVKWFSMPFAKDLVVWADGWSNSQRLLRF